MVPQLSKGGYGVALLGEALGAVEAEEGGPFKGKAGFRLNRLIEWAGLERKKFDIYNTVWCRPENNLLEGTLHESGAISHCRSVHWEQHLLRSKVVVPMGNVATSALLGKKGILGLRGYVEGLNGQYVLPTVHPSYIQRGQSKWSAPFINDLQKAVALATDGLPPQVTDYVLDPSPLDAYRWAQRYRDLLSSKPGTYLAFDIETPGKGSEEDLIDSDGDAPDRTWNIERIGFSYGPLSAISFPWAPEYLAAIRLLLDSDGPKVVWNAGFDVPRIRRVGVRIGGTIHDGMVAWHVLHSDLPKGLRFVATFTCPWQPAWKHLSGAKPAFYNATDADVEYRSMIAIEADLRKTGLWDVYQRDVLDLDPILVHMHQVGMPLDAEIRFNRAMELGKRLGKTAAEMEECVPIEARRIEHVYRSKPRDTSGLEVREGSRLVKRCAQCGCERPRKDHFKRYVKKVNPCADAGVREVVESVDEYYRLADFTPSRDQLVRYHHARGRALPTVWDKKSQGRKVSFGEKQLKELSSRFPDDPLYSLILTYRQLDKVAGTYIGRPDGSDGCSSNNGSDS